MIVTMLHIHFLNFSFSLAYTISLKKIRDIEHLGFVHISLRLLLASFLFSCFQCGVSVSLLSSSYFEELGRTSPASTFFCD